MSCPKISVIMPVYNVEMFLKETIATLQKQTLKDFEVLFVDDGSTDGSQEILYHTAASDGRFKVLRQQNGGAGAARNRGFEAAQGKYCIFLDSDDLFCPDLLEKLYDAAELHQADIATCNFSRFDEKGNVTYRTGIHTEWLPRDIQVFNYQDCPNHIMSVVNPTPWNKLYRSDFIRANNLKYEEISSTNDITFAAVSVAAAERITYVTDHLVRYRIGHAGTISTTKTKNLDNVIIAVSSAVRQARALPHSDVIRDSILRFAVDNYIFALKHYVVDFTSPIARDFYTKVHEAFNEPGFVDMDPQSLHNMNLYRDFYAVRQHDYETMKKNYFRKMIVSLTTFPGRIGTLSKVLDTVYAQTRPADRIVLWLAEEQFPGREQDLPEDLMVLVNDKRLEIRWCDDLKPHKKYFYALQEFTDDLVVTVDDDLMYPKDMLECLYKSYLMYPNAVSTLRAHLILISENGEVLPYSSWIKETDACMYEPSMQLIATGGAGVLYPPNIFRKEFFDTEAIKETCLWADDLWLKAMQTVSEVPVVVARKSEHLRYLPGSQDEALCHTNVDQNLNDVQLAKINEWLDKTFEPGIFAKNLTTLDIGVKILGLKALVEHFDKERKGLKAELRRARTRSNPLDNDAVAQVREMGASLKSLRASGHKTGQLWKQYLIYALAWIPGKILGFLQCILDHGFRYTVKYSVSKLFSPIKRLFKA